MYLPRSERYTYALKMVHRVHELQDEYGWTKAQVHKAIEVMGEQTSYTLHFVGEIALQMTA